MIVTAIGNLTDSIIFGCVWDFIMWPGPGTPNLADIFGDIGLVCFIIAIKKDLSFNSFLNFKSNREDIRDFLKFSKKEVKTFILYIREMNFKK